MEANYESDWSMGGENPWEVDDPWAVDYFNKGKGMGKGDNGKGKGGPGVNPWANQWANPLANKGKAKGKGDKGKGRAKARAKRHGPGVPRSMLQLRACWTRG